MSNLVFPALPGLIFPVKKTPEWKGTIQEAVSGKETRFSSWSYPRWKYELGFELLRDDALNEYWTLVGFFNTHLGNYDSWLFEDPDDKSVTTQAFGTGDGTTTIFPLVRTRGGFVEPVKSLNGSPSIYKAGVLQTLTTHYTITNGVVTFVTAPANGAALTWTGNFYWRCRFSETVQETAKFADKLWEAGKVAFQSVK